MLFTPSIQVWIFFWLLWHLFFIQVGCHIRERYVCTLTWKIHQWTARLFTCVGPSLIALMIIPIRCFIFLVYSRTMNRRRPMLRCPHTAKYVSRFFPYFVSAKSGCPGNTAQMCSLCSHELSPFVWHHFQAHVGHEKKWKYIWMPVRCGSVPLAPPPPWDPTLNTTLY